MSHQYGVHITGETIGEFAKTISKNLPPMIKSGIDFLVITKKDEIQDLVHRVFEGAIVEFANGIVDLASLPCGRVSLTTWPEPDA